MTRIDVKHLTHFSIGEWNKIKSRAGASYDVYMKSEEWRRRRRLIFNRDGWRCTFCGGLGFLECHHLDYTRFGDERPEDLVTICGPCHEEEHDGEG
jgi:5-methylcytosine-specific restriction endonuclease McrA